MVQWPTRDKALFDLLLTSWKELVENVNVEGNLGDGNHEMIEFKILRGETQNKDTRFQKSRH